MFRWIFLAAGGLVVLRVAAAAWMEVYRDRPFSTVLGSVLVVVTVAVLGMLLAGEARCEVRRASVEYGPGDAPAAAPGDDVQHVVHHVVHHHEVVHTYRYAGSSEQERQTPVGAVGGVVVDGEVVRQAIEGGARSE